LALTALDNATTAHCIIGISAPGSREAL